MSLLYLRNFTRFNFTLLRQTRMSISCWSCGKDANKLVSSLFCPSCNALQGPEKDKNYFEVMGVKETYDVEEGELSKKFKDLQKFLHPDKFANKDKKELDVSEKYSSLVNEAYKTLQEPMSRGIYMLKLLGKELPETTEVDPEFLMQIMEKNEEVENAETEAAILRLNKEIKDKIKALSKQLSIAFFDGDVLKVIRLLRHMKYYTSIDTQIQAKIRNKGIIR